MKIFQVFAIELDAIGLEIGEYTPGSQLYKSEASARALLTYLEEKQKERNLKSQAELGHTDRTRFVIRELYLFE